MNRDHSVVFEITPKYCIFESLVDCDSYSISSKGFLPTAVDVMVIWVKFNYSFHFSSLIPKMSIFSLAISCLITSNLPWFMDLTFQVPMQYCFLQHWTLLPSPVTSTAGCCFCFGSASSLSLSKPQNWWWTGKPGVLQSMRLQRVGHDWVTELSTLCQVGYHSWGCFAASKI